MHSAAAIEDRLFTPARIRLTVWYVSILGAVLIVLGTTLYAVVRNQLLSGVDEGVRLVAARAEGQWQANQHVNVRSLSTGSYTVNTITADEFQTGADATGRAHYDPESMDAALQNGNDLRWVASEGDRLRVYSILIPANGGTPATLIQVTRSVASEHDALGKLLVGLLIGGLGGLVLAAIGGWFLARKSLRPVREAFSRQQDFVADASHELRTPLAVIRANAEFLQQEQPENHEAQDIIRETDRLSTLVDGLLAMARGDQPEQYRGDVDLGELVRDVVDAFTPIAAERGIELTAAAGDDLHVRGDREQLRQVLVILLDNALRYTPAAGRVHVQAREDGSSAVLTVHDTGVGIAEEAVERVFERFFRGDEARNRQSGGAGLGLAIARELVAQHSGRISVESTEGAGSTFTVRLPLVREPAKPNRVAR
ncbi:MAG: two-component system, OmpR family, sensor histidine kinase CiaH [Gaiellales bacterium]|jgi:signal transduction histidine kinase|nr:two-component system, OmpR family, sensor histidine kinase CiaH [Gaiellales bacterium]